LRYADNIFQIRNVLPNDNFLEIAEELNMIGNGNQWRFTKSDSEEANNRGFLFKPLGEFDNIGDNLLLIKYGTYLQYVCQKYVKKRLYLHRVNTNLQFFGQESDFHDDAPKGSWTLNLFAQPYWNTVWGGQFVIQTEDGDYFYYPYIPNNALIFPGHLDHMGHAPNVLCKLPRITVAFTYMELTSQVNGV